MLSLIVNGDDFGISENVNDLILKSFQNGILRSVSMMANGKSFDDAVKIKKSNPELDVGVHLTLVKEKPILDSHRLATLLNNEGYFFKDAIEFSKKYYAEKISLDEVKSELTAQIEKIFDHRIKISHLDSHQHLHILPKILDITLELARHYKIKFVRFPKEKFSSYMFHDFRSHYRIAQMSVHNYFCSKVKKIIPFSTDYFAGYYFGGKLNKTNLLTLINHLPPNGTCELMCHPGLVNHSTIHPNLNYQQFEEMSALVDSEVKDLLNKKKIEIASFKALC
jgi:chitin disaccharide deacetylase